MTMEKFGVGADIQHTDLRNLESSLMRQVQEQVCLGDRSDPALLERLQGELSDVRNKLTELDIKKQ